MSNTSLRTGLPVVIVATLAIGGCSTTATKTEHTTQQLGQISQLEEELRSKSTEVSSLQSTVTQLQDSLTTERTAHSKMMEGTQTGAGGSGELLPPNAKPGECYARIYIPPTYKTETDTLKVQEEGERLETIPAKFGWGKEEILIREASERIEIVPATYEWVTEEVMVKPAGKQVVQIPAQYKIESEEILISPEQTVWKKGSGPITKVDQATGEIMCLVTIPAKYRTVSKKVMVSPATSQETETPAEYKTVKKQVLRTPSTTRKIPVPAKYKTIKIKKMVEPPKTRTIQIPAKYETVTKKTKVNGGGMEWRAILCETNSTPGTIRRIQSSLEAKGYDVGGVDGVFGAKTLSAIEAFQIDKGFPKGGVTIKTLQALGVQ
ncbi:MAG: peptidoglycan-binding domain-containing protein [Methylococcales bacterium]